MFLEGTMDSIIILIILIIIIIIIISNDSLYDGSALIQMCIRTIFAP
jgi:hypothetical protein